ncbi:MBL fold metallo-hydrolase (plasmid) [Sinorhizobium medicae]|uniref:MBL fold metallo-hydrolase n=1 Tax=Sinorhizobium medicae TaxID=110321 RepID=UPI002AF6B2E1|nr:MBL fold metallo-hydrolase [Sinorhizobium medicae]WQO62269.1 MBL fold metallo-hydrolase [Sinorhizobium medicae]
MTIKVTLLGTGTPAPSLEKCGSGFLLEDQQKKVLFDCGPGIVGRLLSIGVKPTEITHFVLTHLHFDHVVDFIRLWLQRWDRGRNSIPPLKIYGPVGFKRFVEQLFGRDGAFAPDIHGRIDHPIQQRIHLLRTGTAVQDWPELAVIELSSGDVVELGGWKIFARSVPHYQPYLENLGYRVETDQGIFAYSSDVSVQPDTKATDPTLEGLRELVHQADITVQHLNSVSTEVGLHEPSHSVAGRGGRPAGVQREHKNTDCDAPRTSHLAKRDKGTSDKGCDALLRRRVRVGIGPHDFRAGQAAKLK